MSVWGRVKALQLYKEKSFRILLAVEGVLLILGIAGLFGKHAVYEYGVDGDMLAFQGISLPRGTYRVDLEYETDTNGKNGLEIKDDSLQTGQLRFNPILLYAGWNHTDEEMWLLRDAGNLTVQVIYGNEGQLAVKGLTIRETNAWNRILLFCMLCMFAGVNLVCLWVKYDRKFQVSVKTKTVCFLLGAVSLVASVPFMLDYMWSSADIGYHLLRVEGIKDGILAGQFPIRISPEWQLGYGYASPIFYGETVLYLAAFFRLIGFSVTTSYRLFMFVITVLTVAISYGCFRRIFKDEYVGVFCSALYTLSVNRIFKTLLRGTWGESLGMMFLPLLVLGFYQVFTWDDKQKSYKRSCIPLTLGFAFLIQSHLLTCEMVGFFTILLCILMWKKVFRLRTFLALAKTVICSVLLSMWFLVPFLDYMLTGDFAIQHASKRTIQERGLYFAHHLFTFFESGGEIHFRENGLMNTAPMGVGMVLVLSLALFVFLLWKRKLDKITMQEKTLGKISAAFAVLAMLMSQSLFPWDDIQFLHPFLETLVSSLQFPDRFLTIANVCLVTVAGILARQVLQSGKKREIAVFFTGSILLLTMGSIYLLEATIDKAGPVRTYNSQGMGSGYISGGEYLPYGADATRYMPHDPRGTDGITVTDYEKMSLGAQAYVKNEKTKDGELSFALLYYKGYRAYNKNTGEELPCYAGENFEVTAEIPASYQGMVEVRFVSPWYWRVGEVISLTAVILMIAFLLVKRDEAVRMTEAEMPGWE